VATHVVRDENYPLIPTMMRTEPEATELVASNTRATLGQKILAWMVHALTASGAVWALLAIQASTQARFREALIWLVVAVAVDAVDGTLARLARVKEVIPEFDGALLDNVIDYTTYVIVPALILHQAELLPPGLSLGAAAGICLASAYQFCQSGAKTADHYFRGFPSYWNLVCLYLMTLQLNPNVNLTVIVVLIVLVFVPIKYVYPSRTVPFRRLTLVLTCLWSLMIVTMTWQLPAVPPWLVWSSSAYVAYYVGISLYLTFQSSHARS
jgi:phosphatidylcholine synthase